MARPAGCVDACVFGFFGGISSVFDQVMRAAAARGAQKLFSSMNSVSMDHCTATLLWQFRRTVGAAIFVGNADLVLDRIEHCAGPTCRAYARRQQATGSFFPRGDPTASTWEHRQYGANFVSWRRFHVH